MTRERIRIEPGQAKSRVDAGVAIILDVVAPDTRAKMKRQVAGALRLEPEEFSSRYKEALPQGKQIVAYCT